MILILSIIALLYAISAAKIWIARKSQSLPPAPRRKDSEPDLSPWTVGQSGFERRGFLTLALRERRTH